MFRNILRPPTHWEGPPSESDNKAVGARPASLMDHLPPHSYTL
jgi:hypothetical protein